MSETRPPIPEPVQREVGQRCGFGCVICGAPLYEYHHMDENPNNNLAGNITLLCGTHHTEATKRLLTLEQIALADKKPHNLENGTSSPYGLHFQGENFKCVIGGNSFSSRLRDNEQSTFAVALSVDDIDLIWFRIDRSGNLFLNLNIFDENNLPLLVIYENSLIFSATAWDIQFKGSKLAVRAASRKIVFEIDFIPPTEVLIERARLLCNGVEILVRKSHVFVVNSQQLLVRCAAENCDIGLQLGRNRRDLSAAFTVNPEAICRYHMPASEVERRERQALNKMEGVL